MNPIIIASEKDKAGMNIVANLKNLKCKIPIRIIKEELIHAENIDEKLDCDFIIWASKHQSEKQVKTLSVHPIGNWHSADFGGKPETISPSSANLLKHFFKTLNKNAQSTDYEVSMEVTHHGPLIKTPSLFIEIGSTIAQWADKKAGRIIAETIIKAVKTYKESSTIPTFGIGGPHYAPNFNQIQLESEYAISHIIPEYALPVKPDLIKQILEKTPEKISTAIVDWKGLGISEQKNQILEMLKSFKLEIIKTSNAKSS